MAALSSTLACHHPAECACEIQGINKILCIECHPFAVGQCCFCYRWFLRASLTGKNSAEWKCEECMGSGQKVKENPWFWFILFLLAVLTALGMPFLFEYLVGRIG